MPTAFNNMSYMYIYPTSVAGLLRAVAPRYRYCSGVTFTVAVALLLLIEKNGGGSAVILFRRFFWRYALPLLLNTENV